MTRIIMRDLNGVKYYLTDYGTWTPWKHKAKEYKGRFWIELIRVLLDIARTFGLTNLKYVKK